MKKVKFNKNLAAITTIEIILSMTIFSMIASGVVVALFYGIQSTSTSGSSISANYLAEEQLELITNITHSNFNLLSDGEYHISESGGTLSLVAGSEQSGEFTKRILIAPGIDANTKEITSEVAWNGISGEKKISLVKYLTDWKRAGTVIGTPTPTPAGTPTPPPSVFSCQITYDVYNDWGTGFNADVTVVNTSATDVDGWILEWTFTGDQWLNGAWDAIETQNGAAVSMTNESWNNILPGNMGSETINIYAGNTGSHYAPLRESFKVNGQICDVTYLGISEFAPPPTSGYCHVESTTNYSWGYLDATVVITNISSTYISGWDLNWTFQKKEVINSLWDGSWTQSNKDVAVQGLSYNQNIAPNGGTVSFGYSGTYTGTVSKFNSSDFYLNGVQCE